MSFKSALMASAFSLGLVLTAGQASAIQITGSSSGTFSGLSGCDFTGSSQDCRIVNSGTQVQWGSTSSSTDFRDPSKLTALTESWNFFTPQNDETIAALEWFNSDTKASRTPDEFSVNYTLTFSFTNPAGATGGTVFDLTIVNTLNDGDGSDADRILGFNTAALDALKDSLNIQGVIVDDLDINVVDASSGNNCIKVSKHSSVGTEYDNYKWYNCEDAKAKIYITADFKDAPPPPTTDVPEPATLALLGMGLLGLGAVRRRKTA